MDSILRFIKVFNSPSNIALFTDCACYWFAVLLHERFKSSTIVYNPHLVHFAVRIEDKVYDITGILEDERDYVDWEKYKDIAEDSDIIITNCINL